MNKKELAENIVRAMELDINENSIHFHNLVAQKAKASKSELVYLNAYAEKVLVKHHDNQAEQNGMVFRMNF